MEEFLFDDLTVLPVCDRAELDMKLLVGRRNQLAVRPFHRSAHGACKIRNRTRPFALSNLHFIGMINQMIVGERLEKFDGLLLVIVAPSCGLDLARPKYGGVLGMPLFKRLPVLCVRLRSGHRAVCHTNQQPQGRSFLAKTGSPLSVRTE